MLPTGTSVAIKSMTNQRLDGKDDMGDVIKLKLRQTKAASMLQRAWRRSRKDHYLVSITGGLYLTMPDAEIQIRVPNGGFYYVNAPTRGGAKRATWPLAKALREMLEWKLRFMQHLKRDKEQYVQECNKRAKTGTAISKKQAFRRKVTLIKYMPKIKERLELFSYSVVHEYPPPPRAEAQA